MVGVEPIHLSDRAAWWRTPAAAGGSSDRTQATIVSLAWAGSALAGGSTNEAVGDALALSTGHYHTTSLIDSGLNVVAADALVEDSDSESDDPLLVPVADAESTSQQQAPRTHTDGSSTAILGKDLGSGSSGGDALGSGTSALLLIGSGGGSLVSQRDAIAVYTQCSAATGTVGPTLNVYG
jgi:hypothetical protein